MEINDTHALKKHHASGYISLDFHKLRKAFLILRSLNHDLRQKILIIIKENKKTTVTALYKKLNVEQSIVSQHLALLRKSGVLKTEKDKKFVYYSINEIKLKQMTESIDEFVK